MFTLEVNIYVHFHLSDVSYVPQDVSYLMHTCVTFFPHDRKNISYHRSIYFYLLVVGSADCQ